MERQGNRLPERLRRGLRVFIGLAVLTAIEYAVAVSHVTGLLGWLALMAILKTWLIADYFMHMPQLWRRGEE